MKATGIVRRMDDLGRVVIPKEIRRTLRIREGDPLEIFTDADGTVIFRKYSQIGELSDFANKYAEILHKTATMPALICDCDRVVAAAGVPRKEFLGKHISTATEQYLHSRTKFVHTNASGALQPIEGSACSAGVICPIIASSDVTGAVMLLQEDGQPITETETKLTQAAAAFLGNQLEA